MDRNPAHALIWRLHHFARSLNRIAVLGLGLLAFEAGFYFITVAPMLEARDALRARVFAQHLPATQNSQSTAVNADPRLDLAKFYATLGRPSNVPDLLRRLHADAKNHGLLLQQAEYRPVPNPVAKVLRYQILLPAKGTYPEIRMFLAQASRDLPGLAIDGLNFQRQQIGDGVVDAQIKLSLFLSPQL
jgi:hypothetical protein